MRIGMIGLGKMGSSMSLRLLQRGHEVVGFDLKGEARERLAGQGGEAADTIQDLARALTGGDEAPVVWIMVPAGRPVDASLEQLTEAMPGGSILVDGGNSNYRHTLERAAQMRQRGFEYVDVGTSGGAWGLEQGYSLMVGGSDTAVASLEPVLKALAPAEDRGWGHVGPSGAGHFVKMVHNGIEYGLMEAYAEGFAILGKKEEFDLDLAQVAEVWRHGSVVRSWLLDLTARALAGNPQMDGLEPWVHDSGEGRWTVQEAIDLDVPAPVITLSLIERLSSRDPDSYAHRLVAAMRSQFGGHAVKKS